MPNLPNRLAVSPDGSEYFSTTYSSAWSGIVGVCPATGKVDQISQFPDATMFQDQVLSAAFDGQWLVWTESSTLQLPWLSALMACNAGTNQVTTLVDLSLPSGLSARSASASLGPGVFDRAIADGVLTWAQSTGRRTTGRLSDWNTPTDRIVFQGGAGIPVCWGSRILIPGGALRTNRLVAYSNRTGKLIDLPSGLRRARGVAVGAPSATPAEGFWTDGSSTATWRWSKGDQRAQEVGQDASDSISAGPAPVALTNSDYLWWNGAFSMIVDPGAAQSLS